MIYWDATLDRPVVDHKLDIVRFNIGGERIETYLSTLERVPFSPLARIAQYVRREGCDGEIFMDRNPVCFRAVIDFLRTGHLHYPPSVCGNKFREELAFWNIHDGQMEKCCINEYVQAVENDRKLRYFAHYIANSAHERLPVKRSEINGFHYWRQVIWKTMMVSTYSRSAKIYNVVAFILLLLNVLVILIQSTTIQPIQFKGNDTQQSDNCKLLFGHVFDGTVNKVLFWLDVGFSLIFSAEIIVRFVVAPSFRFIMTSVSTYIELISLIPFYLLCFVVLHLRVQGHCPSTNARVVRILFILRVIRIFRLCFALRNYRTYRAFLYTLRSSIRELLILFTLVTLTTIVTGTIVSLIESAYAESDEHSEFENIFSGLWWALITSTTVGYGDLVPMSPPGRVLTVFVALSGIVVIALATPSVSSNFSLIYTYLIGSGTLTCTTDDETSIDKTNNRCRCAKVEPAIVMETQNL